MIIEADHQGPARAVAERIADAFTGLATAAWLVPDDVGARRRMLAGQFEMVVASALNGHGHVDAASGASGEPAGVAVWLDHTHGEVPMAEDYDERLARICGEHLPRFQMLDEAMEAGHPAAPHLYLALCAVDPARQREGLGERLLRRGLRRADERGAAAYLEAAHGGLTRWYGRHGFERTGQLRLPQGPTMYPMWREPVVRPRP